MKYTALILAILLPFYAATAAEQPQNASRFSATAWHMPTIQGMLTAPATWWAAGGLIAGCWSLKLIKDFYLGVAQAIKLRGRLVVAICPYAYCNVDADRVDLVTKNPEIDRVLPQMSRIANAKKEVELACRAAQLRVFLPFAIENNNKNDIGNDAQKIGSIINFV